MDRLIHTVAEQIPGHPDNVSPDGLVESVAVVARVDKLVPYNADQRAEDRGAHYEKAKLPFVSYGVVGGGTS